MFFSLDSTKVTYQEFCYECGWLFRPVVLLIAFLSKAFRWRISGSTDIPPVDNLLMFRTKPDQVDADLQDLLGAKSLEMEQSGFRLISAFNIHTILQNSRYGCYVLISPDRQTIAWIRNRIFPGLTSRWKYAPVALFTVSENGKIVMTTSAHRDLLDPPNWNTRYLGNKANNLLESHAQNTVSVLGAQRPREIQSVKEALLLLQAIHRQYCKFQTERGVFVVDPTLQSSADEANDSAGIPYAKVANTEDHAISTPSLPTVFDPAIAPLVAKVRKMETKEYHWASKLIWLAVSMAAFVGFGAFAWNLTVLWYLLPILFVHEMGHLIAMKLFGYRNVRMLFIPLLGAAVIGHNHSVPGWKKAVVALAGPVPSIVLALVLGTVSWFAGWEWTNQLVVITLVLNVSNLLPFLPLDGGWVAHATLFCRSAVLDIVFRFIAIACLLLVGILMSKVLLFVGLAMVMSLPLSWKTMKIIERLRDAPLPESVNNQIPEHAIHAIATEIQHQGIKTFNVDQTARLTMSIYETLSSKPPGLLATLGILGAHLGAFFFPILFGIVMVVLRSNNLWFQNNWIDNQPNFVVNQAELNLSVIEATIGTADLPAPALLFWEFENADDARQAYQRMIEKESQSVLQVGNLLFCSDGGDGSEGELEEAKFDLKENERLAREHNRLKNEATQLAKSARRFADIAELTIKATFPSKEKADEFAHQLNSIPNGSETEGGLAPWTPGVDFSIERQNLRDVLAILNGQSKGPWEEGIEFPEFDGTSAKGFRKKMTEYNRLLELKRKQWIDDQIKNSFGIRRELLESYLRFEAALDDPIDGQTPVSISNYLSQNLKVELGLVSFDDQNYRFSADVEATGNDEYFQGPLNEDSETDNFESRTTLVISVYRTVDSAALMGALAKWLKNENSTNVHFEYFRSESEVN